MKSEMSAGSSQETARERARIACRNALQRFHQGLSDEFPAIASTKRGSPEGLCGGRDLGDVD